MSEKNEEYKKYMSYFQKVTTIGVITCGKNMKEAYEEAELTVNSIRPVERCFYDETQFELTDTEEWNPDIEIVSIDPTPDNKSLDYTIKANKEYSVFVAKSLGKKIENLTDKDFENFFLGSMKNLLLKVKRNTE